MGNTVGSFEINTYWQNKWKVIKSTLKINPQQRSLIIGSILGDGTLRIGSKAINANLKIEHGLPQKEYVFWKYSILRPFVFTEPKVSYRYRENRKRYAKSWWFRTVRHPLITEFYKQFYKNGHKIIPDDIEKHLDVLALAVWIMDDGSLSQKRIDISTYSFTEKGIQLLQRVLKKNFGLIANYYRDRDKGYRMYFKSSETKKLILIIKPYILDCLKYKINLKTP